MTRSDANREKLLAAIAEVFREYGYEGASLALIGAATGLGKGSLYNAFPGGKEQMANEVLAQIDHWFEINMYAPLRDAEPYSAITAMFAATESYFRSGRRVCLVGVLALGETRDRFAAPVQSYFARWIAALAGALRRAGFARGEAMSLAQQTVAGIQGAILLSRALNDPRVFARAMRQLHARLQRP